MPEIGSTIRYTSLGNRKRTFAYTNFSGGLNLADDGWSIRDDQLKAAVNLRYDNDGTVRIRRGSWKLPDHTQANFMPIMGMSYSVNGADELWIVGTPGTNIIKYAPAANSWANVSVSRTTAWAWPTRACKMGTHMFFPRSTAGGITGYFTRTGTTISLQNAFASPQNPTADQRPGALVEFDGRLFMTAADLSYAYRNRIWYSKVGNPLSWGDPASASNLAGGAFDISPDDGGHIMDMVVYKGALWVFKSNSIWVVRPTHAANRTDGPTFSQTKITDNYGLWWGGQDGALTDFVGTHRTVKLCAGYIVFMDRRERVIAFDGATFIPLSGPVMPWIKSFNRGANWCAGSFDNRYYIANTWASSANPTCSVFDFDRRVWTQETYSMAGVNSQITMFCDSDAQGKLYIGLQNAARTAFAMIDAQRPEYFTDCSGGTQSGSTAPTAHRRIKMTLQTKDYSLGMPEAIKRLKSFRVLRGEWHDTMSVTPIFDGSDATSVTTDLSSNQSTPFKEDKIPLNQRSRFFGMRIRNYRTGNEALPDTKGDCSFAGITPIWKQQKVR